MLIPVLDNDGRSMTLHHSLVCNSGVLRLFEGQGGKEKGHQLYLVGPKHTEKINKTKITTGAFLKMRAHGLACVWRSCFNPHRGIQEGTFAAFEHTNFLPSDCLRGKTVYGLPFCL